MGLAWYGVVIGLGKPNPAKTDEFLEKFETAFDPPSFSENHIADFATKMADFGDHLVWYGKMAKNANFWTDGPISVIFSHAISRT